VFDYPITGYRDANGDGIIEPGEVTEGTTLKYAGQEYPPIQATLATHVSFLKGRFTLGAQFDYRGGFIEQNFPEIDACFSGACQAAVDPHTSLARQAAVASLYLTPFTAWKFDSDAEYIRFRELSLTYNAPGDVAGWFRARSLSVTLSARNLALWTRYPGPDPETNSLAGDVSGNGNLPQYGPYNDGGLPPAQYWLIRVSMGY
jgi:hypothetical protein